MERFKNIQRFILEKDTETDWYKEYHVKALNLNTFIYENCSDFCADDKAVIALSKDFIYVDWNNIDENRISMIIADMKYEGIHILYTLYSAENNYLVGFVYEDK